MTEEKAPSPRVAALTKLVSLQGVRLVRSQTEFVGMRKGDTLDRLKLDVKAGGRKSPDAPNVLQSFIGLECSVLPRDQERIVAKVSCDFALDYLVSDAEVFSALTDEDTADFASLNGLYNAWPYMREFCQSASLRMVLPAPIVLPSLPLSMKSARPASASTL